MSHNTMCKPIVAVIGGLMLTAACPGQSQSAFEADAFSSITIVTPSTSTFRYIDTAGSVLVTPGSQIIKGDGSADAFGTTSILSNSHPKDTVQATSLAEGSTKKHGKGFIGASSRPASHINLTNTGKTDVTFQIVWSYDIFAHAQTTRHGHDKAGALSTVWLSFNDPWSPINVSTTVDVETLGSAPDSLTLERNADRVYTLTVGAGRTDVLSTSVRSYGFAQSSPEPGTVATLVGLSCGLSGLLIRRRKAVAK